VSGYGYEWEEKRGERLSNSSGDKYFSDQMVGPRDELGIPRPRAPFGDREDIVRPLLMRL
jgi:hypothetical protein